MVTKWYIKNRSDQIRINKRPYEKNNIPLDQTEWNRGKGQLVLQEAESWKLAQCEAEVTELDVEVDHPESTNTEFSSKTWEDGDVRWTPPGLMIEQNLLAKIFKVYFFPITFLKFKVLKVLNFFTVHFRVCIDSFGQVSLSRDTDWMFLLTPQSSSQKVHHINMFLLCSKRKIKKLNLFLLL